MASMFGASEEHSLAFGPGFSGAEVRLLEASPEILEALRRDRSVRFAGAPGEAAVLCTDEATFAVTKVETSNTILLVDPEVEPGPQLVARARSTFHYEATRTEPKVDLAAVLPPYPAAGMAVAAVEDAFSASRGEIRRALRAAGAVQTEGGYSWATDAQINHSIDTLVNSITLRDWTLGWVPASPAPCSLFLFFGDRGARILFRCVPVEACVDDVEESGGDSVRRRVKLVPLARLPRSPQALVRHCLRHFASSSGEKAHAVGLGWTSSVGLRRDRRRRRSRRARRARHRRLARACGALAPVHLTASTLLPSGSAPRRELGGPFALQYPPRRGEPRPLWTRPRYPRPRPSLPSGGRCSQPTPILRCHGEWGPLLALA